MFRSATNADGPTIRDLVFSILREFRFTPDPEGIDSDLTDIETSYLKTGGAFEVLELPQNKIIATVGLLPHSRSVCELRKMYLAPEYRGQGLGRRLLEHAVQTARRLNFKRIELETETRLADAIRLYERFGFQQITCENIWRRCNRVFTLDL